MTKHTIPSLLELLFSTFPSGQGVDRAAQMQAYVVALDGHDMRDIETAIWRLIRGEIDWHNGAFAPSAPLLGNVVAKMRDERYRRAKFDRTYATPVALPSPDVERTPESQARVKAMVEGFVKSVAEALSTEDAKRAAGHNDLVKRTHRRFDPDQDGPSLNSRLMGVEFTVGNDAEEQAA